MSKSDKSKKPKVGSPQVKIEIIKVEPSRILINFRLAIIQEDRCPECLGWLNDGYSCTMCGYNVSEELLLEYD